jgi:hypothetical protein
MKPKIYESDPQTMVDRVTSRAQELISAVTKDFLDIVAGQRINLEGAAPNGRGQGAGTSCCSHRRAIACLTRAGRFNGPARLRSTYNYIKNK